MKILKTPKYTPINKPGLTYKDFTPKQLIEIHHTAIFQWLHINLYCTGKLNLNGIKAIEFLYHQIVTEDTIFALYNMPAKEFIERLINHFSK